MSIATAEINRKGFLKNSFLYVTCVIAVEEEVSWTLSPWAVFTEEMTALVCERD